MIKPTRPPRKRAGVAIVLAVALLGAASAIAAPPEQRPYSCRLLDDAQRKRAFGNCDQRVLQRLERECLRDGGRP